MVIQHSVPRVTAVTSLVPVRHLGAVTSLTISPVLFFTSVRCFIAGNVDLLVSSPRPVFQIFSRSRHSVLFYTSVRYTAWRLDVCVIYAGSPLISPAPPDPVRSRHMVSATSPVLYSHPHCQFAFLNPSPFSRSPQTPSRVAAVGSFSASVSLFVLVLFLSFHVGVRSQRVSHFTYTTPSGPATLSQGALLHTRFPSASFCLLRLVDLKMFFL